jgi:phenol 2-monooxygenase (NADPH)
MIVEWFGCYQLTRKTASKFMDDNVKVFLAGDVRLICPSIKLYTNSCKAAHAHSPKSQGMNTSIHDTWNLAWKLNLAIRGISKPSLLATYEDERRQFADVLLDYDCEESDALTLGDPEAYAEHSVRYARVMSGYGADYGPNVANLFQKGSILGDIRVGSLPPPAKVTRFIDAQPVDLQLDIPMLGNWPSPCHSQRLRTDAGILGQFRILFFTKTILHCLEFLEIVSSHALTGTSVLSRATRATNQSYSTQPPMEATSDDFIRPERYTPISGLFTFSIVLQMALDELELNDLPPLWRESKFTIYLDDVPHLDTKGMTCTEKWLGSCSGSEVDIVVIRPDGYVGTIFRGRGSKENAARACAHLDSYFGGFLNV